MPHTPLYTPFELFTAKECRQLIKYSRREHDQMKGWTVGGIHSLRTNSVYWIHPADFPLKWDFYARIRQHMSARPNLPMDWLQEHWQISVYNQGEYYDWHTDTIDKWKGRTSNRSLTLTCTLQSAPHAHIQCLDHDWDLPTGWAVLFPSADKHRATPPSRDKRWSLTVWGMKWNDLTI